MAGARVQTAGAGGGRDPDVIALHADAVHDVVAQAGVELGEVVDAAGRDAAQAAHGRRPRRSPVRLSSASESTARCARPSAGGRSSTCRSRTVPGRSRCRPDAVAIHQHVEDVVVGQAVRGGEVLPAKPRHVWRAQRPTVTVSTTEAGITSRGFIRSSSIRSGRSTHLWCRSLVTPCVSLGLNTVQISSSVRAEPSCRYGAESARRWSSCGISTSGERSVGLPVPTSSCFWLV